MSSIKQIDGYKIYMNQVLGKGSYGSVYKGISDKTKQPVAVKVLNKSESTNQFMLVYADDYLKNALFSEIKIMECIKSENVVAFFDVMESSKNIYIVQELCDGDFSSVLKQGSIKQAQAIQYLLQIANGFLALVREGIIHRDLKPANIMVKDGKLKIGDFGFAKKSENASRIKNQTIVGSPLYMSLQVLKSQQYSSKCDIWALGFIFYEMIHEKTPWFGKSEYQLIKNIQKKPLVYEQYLSKDTKDFLKKCLGVLEKERLSWDELFVHPIFKGYFIQKTHGSQEFQNKLKVIMNELRFKINSQNLDLVKILSSLGYKNSNHELNRDKFYQFLKFASEDISRDASNYIFDKTDSNKNGTISIAEIEKMMNENKIDISNINHKIPGYGKNFGTESFQIARPDAQAKIKNCFGKMMRDIMSNNSSLKQVFEAFDKNNANSLNRTDFMRMLKSVSKDLHDDQINGAFELIDSDGSNSIDYKQLNYYYSRVNGLPEERANEMQKSNQFNNGYYQNQNNFNGGYQQHYQQQYQQPYQQPYQQQQSQGNPFGGLFGQGSGNLNQQQQFYPNYNYYAQGQQGPQQQQQQQQQAQGLFGNFIFNQLSQNMKR